MEKIQGWTTEIGGIIMDLTGFMGTVGLALGGSILFFALSFIINQAQVPKSILCFSRASCHSSLSLVGLHLYRIVKSATLDLNNLGQISALQIALALDCLYLRNPVFLFDSHDLVGEAFELSFM